MAAGYGQYVSRFIDLCDIPEGIKYTDMIREVYNRILYEGHEFAEISGVFGFNGNIHSPIAPYEIIYPGMVPNSNFEESLKIEDLSIHYLAEEDKLIFKTKKNDATIHPLYLGFLTWYLLPPIYRLLFFMVPSNYMSLPIAKLYFFQQEKAKKQVVVKIPRIKINNLVITRKQWWIPSKELPYRHLPYGDLERCMVYENWRKSQGLPREVFIKILNLLTKKELTSENKGNEDEIALKNS